MTKVEQWLRIDDRFTHLVSSDQGVVLVGEDDATLLDSPRVTEVLRLVAGGSTAVEIAELLADNQPPEVTHFTILALERAGVVRRGLGDEARQAHARPLETDEASGAAELGRSLGLTWRERCAQKAVSVPLGALVGAADESSLTLVLTDDYLHTEVAQAVRDGMRNDAARVLLACVGTRRIWLGPSYVTRRSSCIECLRERLRLNLTGRALLHLGANSEHGLRIERLDRGIPAEAFRRLAATLFGVLARSPGVVACEDSLRVVDVAGVDEGVHRVLQLPQCQACGDPTMAPPGAAVSLTPRRKAPGSGGGYRTVDPSETLRRDTWAGTRRLGLLRLDAQAMEFRPFRAPAAAGELGAQWAWPITEDAFGNLWVGAYSGGLYRIAPDRQSWRLYSAGATESGLDRILTVFVDSRGLVWVGTEGQGMSRLDPSTGELRRYSTADGLPHDNVEAITEDAAGDLWISTNDGIARFDVVRGEFRAYRETAGLTGNRFFANSVYRSGNGEIYFGGESGLTILDPPRMVPQEGGPTAALTAFRLNGTEVPLAMALAPGGLDLEPDENFFAFEFSSVDFRDPSENRYRYRLVGLDDDWIDNGTRRVANYTSVPPGDYTISARTSRPSH